jgi:HEAT repeat protein
VTKGKVRPCFSPEWGQSLRAIALGTLAACVVGVSSPNAMAEEPAEPGQMIDPAVRVRYEATVTIEPDRPDLHVRLLEEQVRRRMVHHLEVSVVGSSQVLCKIPVQREFVARYYDHRTEVARIGRNHWTLLLETHVPDSSLAPPDPGRHQLAMHLKPDRRSQWSCRLVARGEFTRLDGGRQLRIDREIEPPQLLRSDTTEGTRFCGLQQTSGFSNEFYEPEQERFVPRAKVEVIKEGAPVLEATLATDLPGPPMLTAVYSWAWATSDYRGTPSGAVALRPLALGDMDLSTAWIEGGNDLGREEYVTASVNEVVSLVGLRIFPGHGASLTNYQAHARPTRVLVAVSDGRRFVVELPEVGYEAMIEAAGLFVSFPEPIRTNCLSVMILDSRPGRRRGADAPVPLHRAAAISEIVPISDLDGQDRVQTAHRLVEAIASEPGHHRRERLYQMSGKLGEDLVRAIANKLETGTSTERQRVLPLLGRLDPGRSLPVLVETFRQIPVDAPEYRVLQRTLAAHGAHAAELLLPVLEDLPLEDKKHVDTIRLIGRIGTGNDIEALLPGLGQGSDFLRNERIRAIAHGRRGVVEPLIVMIHTQPDTPAAYDALKALTTIGRRLYLDEGAQVEGVQGLLPAVEANRLRRHILRGLQALSYFAIPDGLARLRTRYLEGSPDPLVRQAAAGALEYYPSEQAREALEAALDDPSPDVRIAAIAALSGREDRHMSLHRVLAYGTSEQWPQALNHAYTILAEIEVPETNAFFEALLPRYRDDQLAIVATRALKRAERSVSPEIIESLLEDLQTPLGLRRQLIDLLGHDETEKGEAILLEIIRRKGASHGARRETRAEILDRHALLAIGLRRSERGRSQLLAILKGDEALDRRQNAARALGFFADEDLLITLRELATSVPDELQSPIEESIRMIENRLAIEEAQIEIQDAIDGMDE